MNPEETQHLLNCLDDMIVVVDPSLTVQQVNRLAYETLAADYQEGTDPAACVGKPLQAFFRDGEFFLRVENALQQVMAGQLESFNEQISFATAESTGFFKLTVFPNVQGGQITGAIMVFNDLFYEKELQEQLLQTEELFTFKEVLLGAANELNNLLTIIASSATLIQNRPGIDEKLVSDITMIGDQTLRAKGIVANLLTLAKKHESKIGRVDINQVVQKTFEIRQYELTVNNLLIEFDLHEVPLTVGDSYRMQQLVLNLMNHSMESIITSGLTGTIKMGTYMEGDMIKLVVSDNGPSFPEQDLPQLFNAFYANPDSERKVGMGLSICRRIVSEHGGQISVKNVFPRGRSLRFSSRSWIPSNTESQRTHLMKP
ncbi:ATP-binding protein [Oscillatoria laete-virens NRMC-F 0139]|nr:ATP-binding protein [Oscillatoria laete-virens]MDL5055014.1 ATP-binding protein [Oscillatoria laete-virens NRMC-F 0139]